MMATDKAPITMQSMESVIEELVELASQPETILRLKCERRRMATDPLSALG